MCKGCRCRGCMSSGVYVVEVKNILYCKCTFHSLTFKVMVVKLYISGLLMKRVSL